MKFSTEFNNEQEGEARGKRMEALPAERKLASQAPALSLRDRLAEGARLLEHLDQERTSRGDPDLGRVIEERIVSRELLDLELEDFDHEVDKVAAAARRFLTPELIAGVVEPRLFPSKGRSLQR